MISIKEGKYVVESVEYGIYQDMDPDTRLPFISEARAIAWFDATKALIDADHAAEEAKRIAALRAKLSVHISVDETRAMLGTPITLSAVFKNALDEIVLLNDNFAVPIQNDIGDIALIKLATFVNGTSTVVFTPKTSGYFCITEKGINHKLPEGVNIGLPTPIEVVIYE